MQEYIITCPICGTELYIKHQETKRCINDKCKSLITFETDAFCTYTTYKIKIKTICESTIALRKRTNESTTSQ